MHNMYQFNIYWFIVGVVLIAAGVCVVRFYKEISDNFLYGPNSYQTCKLWGIGFCIGGVLICLNLHTFVIDLIGRVIFSGMINRGE